MGIKAIFFRHLPVLLCAILLVGVPVARGQAPPPLFLADLTWLELRDQIASGQTLIIIPVGGTEQNGPAIALGKHNRRVKVLAGRIAQALGTALVAPVISYVPEGTLDPPTAHLRFPGTITIPDHTFRETLEFAARSFKRHGFRDIVFLGDHGGYQGAFTVVAERLNREWAATAVRAHAIREYYRAGTTTYVQALKNRGYQERQIGTHAGLADTSLMLAVDARLVRVNQLLTGTNLDAPHGIQGDPRRAKVELGQLGVDAIVTQTVAAIRRAAARE